MFRSLWTMVSITHNRYRIICYISVKWTIIEVSLHAIQRFHMVPCTRIFRWKKVRYKVTAFIQGQCIWLYLQYVLRQLLKDGYYVQRLRLLTGKLQYTYQEAKCAICTVFVTRVSQSVMYFTQKCNNALIALFHLTLTNVQIPKSLWWHFIKELHNWKVFLHKSVNATYKCITYITL